jgi:hypothetical protein
MGSAQIVTWIVLFANGTAKRDYSSTPIQTLILLIAELLTAIAVITGGIGILAGRKWGIPLSLAALGMMLYCVIFSCGVFWQTGVAPAAAFFAAASVLTAAAVVWLLVPSLP